MPGMHGSTTDTITSTLSATIASEFGDLTIIAWLASAYLIGTAAVFPISGKLSDIFGRRQSLIFCAIVFAVGNLVCGLAQSNIILILGRLASGIGGGGLNSIGTYTATDLIPLRQRGLWQGYSMVVYGVGIGLGGVVGGAINDSQGWRWAFLILTPLTLLCVLGLWCCVPDITRHAKTDDSILARIRRIDFLGAATLDTALILLLSAFNYAKGNDSKLPVMNIALPIAAVLLVLFVLIEEKYALEPIIELGLLRNRTITGVCLAFFFTTMSVYTLMFYIPIDLQVRGFRPGEVGIRMLPWSICSAVGSLSTGIILRATGYLGSLKFVIRLLFTGGCACFSAISVNTPLVIPELCIAMTGFAVGGMLTVLTLNLLCAVEHEMQAVTSAMCYTFRSAGSTLGISLSSLLFRQVLTSQLPNRSDRHLPGRIIKQPEATFGGSSSDEIRDGYMYALRATFLLALGWGAAGLISTAFTKNFVLSSTITRKSSAQDNQDGEEER